MWPLIRSLVALAVALALLGCTLAGPSAAPSGATTSAATHSDATSPSATAPASPATTAAASAPASASPAPAVPSGFTVVERADLPPEARDTLALIDVGGPYPYRQDGSTFQNREGLLPDRPDGHYREFTVETPGSADRGARRIVAGADGERYWTDDHYDSFRWIAR